MNEYDIGFLCGLGSLAIVWIGKEIICYVNKLKRYNKELEEELNTEEKTK